MEDKFIIEAFLADEFNLSRREITLYLSLIKKGASTIFELADASDMNRSTTHVNIDSLTQKGLVTQVRKGRGSRRLIMAEPVDKLALLLRNKKAKIEAAEQQLPKIIQEMTHLKKENPAAKTMEIRRYTGEEEVKLIYDDVLKANEIRTYANTSEMLKIFPGNIQKFIDAHKKNHNMRIWEILKDSEVNRDYAEKMVSERFFCRLVTEVLMLPSTDYFIFDDKVAVIEIAKGIISGMVIENKNFYESSKAVHEFVWNYLPHYEKRL